MRRPCWITLTLVAVLALAGVVTAGCGGDEQQLDGTSWRLEGWSVSSQSPADFEITAIFTSDQVSGAAPVNTYSAGYTVTADGGFSVGELARTLMAGSEQDMKAEDTYFQLLADAKAYEFDGGQLVLSDANGNELLIYGSQE
jgi:heat shock protein HslJ